MLRIGLIILLCFASSLLGSAVTVLVMSPEEEPSARPSGYLVARELVLTDASGRSRVRLQGESFAGAPGGQIVFYDDREVPRMQLAMESGGPAITLRSSELPDPDHKRIRIAVDGPNARIDVGHGELEELVIESGPPTMVPANAFRLVSRNGSTAGLYTDRFGHATLEVTDLTTSTVLRVPEEGPLLP